SCAGDLAAQRSARHGFDRREHRLCRLVQARVSIRSRAWACPQQQLAIFRKTTTSDTMARGGARGDIFGSRPAAARR
ncbi:hypothetical protein ABTJ96_19815, partial [Acinetobacter baumannii]